MLYQWEVGRGEPAGVPESYWALDRAGTAAAAAVRERANQLALGTISRVKELDPIIATHAQHWRLSRMAVVDRQILRLAVFELQEDQAAPASVVIDEALELARTFSTEDAVKFVNGVLDAIRRALAGGGGAPPLPDP